MQDSNSKKTQLDKKKFIKSFILASEVMENLRIKELPLIDIQTTIQQLLPLYSGVNSGVSPTSGLIEQQRLFAKGRD